MRGKLRSYAHNQPQITDSSHLIVLCARTDIDEKYVKKYIAQIAKIRNVSIDSLKAHEDGMIRSMKNKSQEVREDWAQHQVYIALGMLLSACAQKRIDSCPIGYRSKDDEFLKKKKVRFEKGDIFEFL